MRQILARPEFQKPPRSIFDIAYDFIGRQLSRLLRTFFGSGAPSLIAWGILIVAAGVVVAVILRARASLRAEPRVRVGDADERVRPAREWRAEAEVHEAKGEWKQALRCRYRALVADLASRGLVDEIPGRTTGEYRREVTVALPLAADDFSGATELFELAWYGEADTGQDEHSRFRGHADRVLAGVR
ncbi:MAG: hypothetical protein QOG03_764 [Actinomycetota bacterium]|jgi:hypothetical protein|nr:hypothetical protein [Actinomycetota bacterium]